MYPRYLHNHRFQSRLNELCASERVERCGRSSSLAVSQEISVGASTNVCCQTISACAWTSVCNCVCMGAYFACICNIYKNEGAVTGKRFYSLVNLPFTWVFMFSAALPAKAVTIYSPTWLCFLSLYPLSHHSIKNDFVATNRVNDFNVSKLLTVYSSILCSWCFL